MKCENWSEEGPDSSGVDTKFESYPKFAGKKGRKPE